MATNQSTFYQKYQEILTEKSHVAENGKCIIWDGEKRKYSDYEIGCINVN